MYTYILKEKHQMTKQKPCKTKKNSQLMKAAEFLTMHIHPVKKKKKCIFFKTPTSPKKEKRKRKKLCPPRSNSARYKTHSTTPMDCPVVITCNMNPGMMRWNLDPLYPNGCFLAWSKRPPNHIRKAKTRGAQKEEAIYKRRAMGRQQDIIFWFCFTLDITCSFKLALVLLLW